MPFKVPANYSSQDVKQVANFIRKQLPAYGESFCDKFIDEANRTKAATYQQQLKKITLSDEAENLWDRNKDLFFSGRMVIQDGSTGQENDAVWLALVALKKELKAIEDSVTRSAQAEEDEQHMYGFATDPLPSTPEELLNKMQTALDTFYVTLIRKSASPETGKTGNVEQAERAAINQRIAALTATNTVGAGEVDQAADDAYIINLKKLNNDVDVSWKDKADLVTNRKTDENGKAYCEGVALFTRPRSDSMGEKEIAEAARLAVKAYIIHGGDTKDGIPLKGKDKFVIAAMRACIENNLKYKVAGNEKELLDKLRLDFPEDKRDEVANDDKLIEKIRENVKDEDKFNITDDKKNTAWLQEGNAGALPYLRKADGYREKEISRMWSSCATEAKQPPGVTPTSNKPAGGGVKI